MQKLRSNQDIEDDKEEAKHYEKIKFKKIKKGKPKNRQTSCGIVTNS